MSWPVRATVLRVQSEAAAISDWLARGDPPYLGQIAARCRNLRAVETDTRGSLSSIGAPAQLERRHLALIRAFTQARAECTDARHTALAARDAVEREFTSGSSADARRAQTAARTSLRRFDHTTLRTFTRAVRTWRSAVLEEAARVGTPAPAWVTQLPL